jgi:flavin reductase (NADH)
MSAQSRRPIEATIRTADPGEPVRPAGLLREALSHWASGVAVLAVSDGEEIDAITVSAFSALSLDPPLVLAAIGEQASILDMLRAERGFTLSVLAEEQRAAAGVIAQRLPGAEAIFVAVDEPAVVGALAVLRCSLWKEYDGGDHRLVVGRVEHVTLGPERAPLVYYRREYRGVR